MLKREIYIVKLLRVLGFLRLILDRGADHVHLMPLAHLFFNKPVQAASVGRINGEGADLLSSRGHFVEAGDVEIAVLHEGQRPRDRCCGHDKRMRRAGFFLEGGALCHAEAVLFVGDHEGKT